MKSLVPEASKHGSTREIAEAMADELRPENAEVDLKDLQRDGKIEDEGKEC